MLSGVDIRPGAIEHHLLVFSILELGFLNLVISRSASSSRDGVAKMVMQRGESSRVTADITDAEAASARENAIKLLKQAKKYSGYEFSQPVNFWSKSGTMILGMEL